MAIATEGKPQVVFMEAEMVAKCRQLICIFLDYPKY